jgi:hypothetical protein
LKKVNKSARIQFRTDKETSEEISIIAETTGEKISSTCDRLIKEALEARKLDKGINAFIPLLEKALQHPMKSLENRLAGINVKTNLQAGISRYLLEEALQGRGRDIYALVEEARIKALLDLKAKTAKNESDE